MSWTRMKNENMIRGLIWKFEIIKNYFFDYNLLIIQLLELRSEFVSEFYELTRMSPDSAAEKNNHKKWN